MASTVVDSGAARAASHDSVLRRVAREIRYSPERIMHARRRAAAQRRIAGIRELRSALFICHGNVCRSPFAAYVFRRLMERAGRPSGTHVDVHSAGFIGPGRRSPEPALAAATRRGYDISEHRSSPIEAASVRRADLVVVMSQQQAASLRRQFGPVTGVVIVLGDLDPRPIRRRTIKDPWGCDAATFDDSFGRVERCVEAIVEALSETAIKATSGASSAGRTAR